LSFRFKAWLKSRAFPLLNAVFAKDQYHGQFEYFSFIFRESVIFILTYYRQYKGGNDKFRQSAPDKICVEMTGPLWFRREFGQADTLRVQALACVLLGVGRVEARTPNTKLVKIAK